MLQKNALKFDPDCRNCARLAEFLDQTSAKYPDYHARPVPAFGDSGARLLIVGLAPGMHGANATGRPFTGDYAGILLYQTLFDFGFSNHPESVSRDDGLRLTGCRITNAVKCLPPQNKPQLAEVRNCNRYLHAEISALPKARCDCSRWARLPTMPSCGHWICGSRPTRLHMRSCIGSLQPAC